MSSYLLALEVIRLLTGYLLKSEEAKSAHAQNLVICEKYTIFVLLDETWITMIIL